MAYATRYTTEFKSSTGKQYRITLLQDGYSGSTSTPSISSEGFILNYTSDNSNSGVIQRVMGSGLTVTYLLDDLSILADLANATDKTFFLKVEIYIALAYYDYFLGYVTPDLSGYADEPAPTFVSFTATDGFGWAKNYPFYDNSGSEPVPITGKKTHIELLQTCLTNIGLIQESSHATPLVVGSGSFREFGHTFGNPYLEETRVNAEIFARCEVIPDTYDPTTGEIEYTTTYSTIGDVLEYLCNFWGCRLFQSFGRWWFMPNDAFYDVSMTGYTYASGALTNTATLAFTSQYANTSYDRLKGGRFQYFPSKNNAEAIYNYFKDPIASLDFIDAGESYTIEGYYPAEITLNFSYTSVAYYANEPSGAIEGEEYGDLGIPAGNTIRFLNIYKISLNDEWYYVNRVVKVAPNITTSLPRWVRDEEKLFTNITGTTVDISSIDEGRMPDMERMIYVEVNGEVMIYEDDYDVDLAAKTITFSAITLVTSDTIKVKFMHSEYAHYHHIVVSTNAQINTTGISLSPSASTMVIPKAPEQGTLSITCLQECRPAISRTSGDYVYWPRTFYKRSPSIIGGIDDITDFNFIFVAFEKDIEASSIESNYDCIPPNNGSVNYLSTNTNSDQSDSTTVTLASGDGLFPDGTNDTTNCFTATEVYVGGQWELSDQWLYSSAGSLASMIGTHHELIAKIHIALQATPTRFYQGTIFEDIIYAPTYSLMLDLDGAGAEPLVPINLSFNANMDHWTGKWLQIQADVNAAG